MMELLAVLQCADDSGEDEGEADKVDGAGVGDSTPPPPPIVQLLVNGKGSFCGACLVLLLLFLLSAESYC
jgi:hypothetical protein